MSDRKKEKIEEIWIKGNKNRKIIKPEIMLVEINMIQSYTIVIVGSQFSSNLPSGQQNRVKK